MSLKRKKKRISPDEYRTFLRQFKNPTEIANLIEDLFHETEDSEIIEVLAELFLDPINNLNTKPMINYKGEILDKSMLKIPKQLAFLGKIFPEKQLYIKNCFNLALKKYYTYFLLVKEILNASENLNFSQDLAESINTFIWIDSPPTLHVKKTLIEISSYATPNSQENFLFWLLFTPEIIAQDFATNFHEDVFNILVNKLGLEKTLLLTYHAILHEIQKNIIDWSILPKNYLEPFNEALELIQRDYWSHIINYGNEKRKEVLLSIIRYFEQSDSEHFLLSFDPLDNTEFTNNFVTFWQEHLLSRSRFRRNILKALSFEKDKESIEQVKIIEETTSFNEEKFDKFAILIDTIFLKNPNKKIIEENRIEFDRQLSIILEFMEWQFFVAFTNPRLFNKISSHLFYFSNELINFVTNNKDAIYSKYINLVAQTLKEISSQYQFRRKIFNRTKEITNIREQYTKREEKYQRYNVELYSKREIDFSSLIDIIQHQKSRFIKVMFTIDQTWMHKFIIKMIYSIRKILSNNNISISFKPRFKRISLVGILYTNFKMSPLIEDDVRNFYRLIDDLLDKERVLKRYNSISFRRIESIINVVNEFISNPETYEFEIFYINHDFFK